MDDINYWVPIIVWGAVMLASIIIELETVDLTSIWVAVGAIAALTLAILEKEISMQLYVFAGTTAVSLIIGKFFVKKKITKEFEKTNIDAYKGKFAFVQKEFNIDTIGEVKFEGKVWSAKTLSDSTFVEGEKVVIISTEGNKLVVDKTL